MERYRTILEFLLLPTALAVAGFAVRLARFGAGTWKQLASGLVVSAFVGVLVGLGAAEANLPPKLQYAVISLSGYFGGVLLDAFQARVLKAVKYLPGPGADQQE